MSIADRFVAIVMLFGCAANPRPVVEPPPVSLDAENHPPAIAPAASIEPIALPDAKAPQPPKAGDDAVLATLLSEGGKTLKAVVASPEKYRFQVLYTPIDQGKTLVRHSYRADAEYFFPASSMKVPITLGAYDRLAALQATKPTIVRTATLRIYPKKGDPYVTTLARETWRALIVSDNNSANRLLGFVGHRELHEQLWALKLATARIHTGFSNGTDIDPAEQSPRIEVVTPNGSEEISARTSDLVLPATDAKGLGVGVATMVNGKRVEGALSFADKNAMHLRDLQDTLIRIVRPDLLPPADPMTKDDRDYVKQALGTLPSTSGLAGFDRNVVADYQLSPFLRGLERVRARDHFEIYTKVGQAFGFLTANAYIVDKDTGRSFFLIATIYANPNETMNDDNYAYDTISFPALADVAETCAKSAFGK